MNSENRMKKYALVSSVSVCAALMPFTTLACIGSDAARIALPLSTQQKFSLINEQCASLSGTGGVPVTNSVKNYSRLLELHDLQAARVPSTPSPAFVDRTFEQGMRGGAFARGRGARNEARSRLAPSITSVARTYDIDPLLLHAVIHVESRYNPAAVSHAGARGLMQVIPATARRFGVTNPITELADPQTNIEVGAAYLKTLQGMFGNNLTLVLAAYNAGEGAVMKHKYSVPPYRETQAYVRDVLAHYRSLQATASYSPQMR
jgi:soluble lytic murein transglycosylase-like protein